MGEEGNLALIFAFAHPDSRSSRFFFKFLFHVLSLWDWHRIFICPVNCLNLKMIYTASIWRYTCLRLFLNDVRKLKEIKNWSIVFPANNRKLLFIISCTTQRTWELCTIREIASFFLTFIVYLACSWQSFLFQCNR